MSTFLPIVLQAMEHDQHQFLLLASLKEIILMHANKEIDFSLYLDAVVPGLTALCRAEEEGVRNMVAECFGALVYMYDSHIVPHLQAIANNLDDKIARWTVASALRYALSRQLNDATILVSAMGDFLRLLVDSDLEVRKASLLMTNTIVHHNPDIIAPHLLDVIPILYETLQFKQEKTVDLGPFKHKVNFCCYELEI